MRDVGVQKFVKLPRIAVLGSQSAGKSSVLESIVGLDFLPRGDGLVTRRPLELRLNHQPEGTKPWAEFSQELKGKKFTNFKQVRDTIIELTDKVAGTNTNIVDDPIVLNVYSHTCPDLTLVDLPGITLIPIPGQPENIEQITRSMAERYVCDSRTIILCVVSANADMATQEGLRMARRIDPKGIRTVGVITKIDIMDRGTNAKRMIMNQEIQLRLGFVGVKNRSQEDIQTQISVKAAMEKEMAFFSSHPVYSTMPPGYLGCEVLTTKLTRILFTHIRHSLPDIVNEIREKLKETENELKDLGEPMPSTKGEKTLMVWGMITEFVQSYKNQIAGKFDSQRRGVQAAGGMAPNREFSAGSQIKMKFYGLYAEFEHFNATQEYSDGAIEKAIAMHEGDSISGFPSVDVLNYLIAPQLDKLRDPALELIQDSYAQLEALASSIVERIFLRVPTLRPELMDIICQILQRERDHTRELVEAVIDSEQNYIFVNDADYKENRTSIVPQEDQMPPQYDAAGNPIPQNQPNMNQQP